MWRNAKTLYALTILCALAACASAPAKLVESPAAPATKITPGILVEVAKPDAGVVLPQVRITRDRDTELGTSLDWDPDAIGAASVTSYVYLIGNLGKDVPDSVAALKVLPDSGDEGPL